MGVRGRDAVWLRDHINLGHICLTFTDGHTVDLGIDQTSLDDIDDRDRSDKLIDAIRAHTRL
ncbi:hypothetical protein LV457_02595 [Mycobacterium sp. MYCO198283]|uniref:hypothetical protein n=1 Tax=Mycobacterium sp. MYCO198283 TaxID=2883505 RepID=UPI001E4D844A|nr:hypothetical protein [Mycobacterium sp. MYCO198283]MCG5431183.1 hypothetical protein [Mycobacterium sp. MYCO198283]